MRTLFVLSTLVFGIGVAIGAESTPPNPNAAPSKSVAAPPEGQTPVGAGAQLKPTQGNAVKGTLNFVADAAGVRVAGLIEGLKPGAEQGFHIHEKGDCSAPDASSAGGHFNPGAQAHGNPTGAGAHHAGDMSNLRADAKGVAKVDVLLKGVTLRSREANDIVGKAVVVHQKADDYKTQPSGDSGARVACGVIE